MACQTCLFFLFTNNFFFLVPALFQTLCFREQDDRSQDPQGFLSVAAEWTVSRGTVSSKPEARTQAREGLYSCFRVSSARFLPVLSLSALSPFAPLLYNILHLVAQQHPPSWLPLDTRATRESGLGLHLSVYPICEYTSMCLEPCWPLIPSMIPPLWPSSLGTVFVTTCWWSFQPPLKGLAGFPTTHGCFHQSATLTLLGFVFFNSQTLTAFVCSCCAST